MNLIKKIRRYLFFFYMLTFAAVNIADLGIFLDDETLEAASIQIEAEAVETESSFEESPQQEKQELTDSHSEHCEDSPYEETVKDTSVESVSNYIHTYQKLPPVYITKKEASVLGWLGGGLAHIDKEKSIGGDYFGNYQGLLPVKDGRCYWECDIDALGSQTRGMKRLVYSNDGLMFYTDDHYETFHLLYSEWNSEKNQIL